MSDGTPGPTSAPTTGASAISAPGAERTIGQLVADASNDLSSILRSEVALAKAELQADVKAAATGAGMFVGAAVLAFLALILILIAAAFGLVALGVAPWLAFLIVAIVLLIITGVLGLLGRSQIRRAGAPERTLRTSRETVETLKGVKPHTR